jgi:hypothetical protein
MVWTSRLETASHKQIIIVFVVSAIWLIGSVILGMAGPSLLQRTPHSSWNCSDNNHTIYNPHTCNGVQLSSV